MNMDSLQLQQAQEQRLKEILSPEGCGLLVVDMQNDFLSPEGKSAHWGHNYQAMQAIVPKVREAIRLFRERARPVIWTKNYEDPKFRSTAGLDRFLWMENNDADLVACLQGSHGAEFYIKPHDEDVVIEKRRFSAYIDTGLKDVIHNLQLKTVVIVGVKTQCCVMRTTHDLSENEPDLHVVVLEDCVASDDQIQHNAVIAELNRFYPPVIQLQTLKEKWG